MTLKEFYDFVISEGASDDSEVIIKNNDQFVSITDERINASESEIIIRLPYCE